MKCNYDDWDTKVVKGITPKMRNALRVMSDCRVRSRAEMLRSAGIDPNPLTATGYVGNERTDFYLYRKGLIKLVGMDGHQKLFQITETGLEEYDTKGK